MGNTPNPRILDG
jgi:hypothetical protein